jgi:WD40 repeat protein
MSKERNIMSSKKFLILIFLVVIIFSLSSCNKANQDPESNDVDVLPSESYPAPIFSETQTDGYPIPKSETPIINAYPDPINTEAAPGEGFSPLDLISEFSIDEPARMKWCADQNCFSLIGYGYFKVISYPEFNELFTYESQENEYFLDVSSDGKSYATTTNNQDIIIKNWKSDAESVIQTDTSFMSASFSPDGKNIMLTKMDEWGAAIFDVENGERIATLTGFETAAPVYDVRYGQSTEYAIWMARATIQVSEIATNQLFPAIFHQDFIIGYDLNNAGTFLATSAAEATNDEFFPTVFLYDFRTGELIHKLTTEKSVYSLQFSPDNSHLAMANGNLIAMLDMNTLADTNHFVSNDAAISQIVFSPDGSILVSSDEGLRFMFWGLN